MGDSVERLAKVQVDVFYCWAIVDLIGLYVCWQEILLL